MYVRQGKQRQKYVALRVQSKMNKHLVKLSRTNKHQFATLLQATSIIVPHLHFCSRS